MVIHTTKKLAERLPMVSTGPLQEISPLGGWHANRYTIDRRQCVMFCHDQTRYVLFMAGLRKPLFEQLGRVHRDLFLATLEHEGVPREQVKAASLLLGAAVFDRATDPSVLGSLRIAKQDLDAWVYRVPNVLNLDPVAMSARLNDRPATVRKVWIHPAREMAQLLASCIDPVGRQQ